MMMPSKVKVGLAFGYLAAFIEIIGRAPWFALISMKEVFKILKSSRLCIA